MTPNNRNYHRKRNYAQTRQGAVATGARWTREEDRAILSRSIGGSHGLTDRQLSAILGRSVQSIQVRRSRIRPL